MPSSDSESDRSDDDESAEKEEKIDGGKALPGTRSRP